MTCIYLSAGHEASSLVKLREGLSTGNAILFSTCLACADCPGVEVVVGEPIGRYKQDMHIQTQMTAERASISLKAGRLRMFGVPSRSEGQSKVCNRAG